MMPRSSQGSEVFMNIRYNHKLSRKVEMRKHLSASRCPSLFSSNPFPSSALLQVSVSSSRVSCMDVRSPCRRQQIDRVFHSVGLGIRNGSQKLSFGDIQSVRNVSHR